METSLTAQPPLIEFAAVIKQMPQVCADLILETLGGLLAGET